MTDVIYLDNNATTPCDPSVIEAMLPYFGKVYANPASSVHAAGREAAGAVDSARSQVAQLIGAFAGELVFTSGATEANNLAILGLARAADVHRKRIVTSAVEHKAVLEPCRELVKQGFEVIYLPVDGQGRVDLTAAEEAINEETLLVSMQAANNEIGTIQPVAEVSRLAHERGALFHCDAAQAVGKVPVDVAKWDVDLLSLSAHKLYGPKGVGALYVRGGPYALPLAPLLIGGGQERGLRAGTLNVPGIVGVGVACELCSKLMPDEAQRIAGLRDRLENLLLDAYPSTKRNGALTSRLPGTISITFPGIDAESLILNVPDLAISAGSACTAGAPEPSHVLLATGLDRKIVRNTVRIGLGRFTTQDEVEQAAIYMQEAYQRLIRLRA